MFKMNEFKLNINLGLEDNLYLVVYDDASLANLPD